MDPFQALCELPKIVEEYKRVTTELIQAQKELAALKGDQYVTWEWVCRYFGVTRPTAVAMLSNEKVFVFGRQVKRFKKSTILNFAERNSIKAKDIPT